MGSFSLGHWLIVLVIVLVLFGRGRVADIMGEFGKGLKSFKEGVNEEEYEPARRIQGPDRGSMSTGHASSDNRLGERAGRII